MRQDEYDTYRIVQCLVGTKGKLPIKAKDDFKLIRDCYRKDADSAVEDVIGLLCLVDQYIDKVRGLEKQVEALTKALESKETK